MWAFKDQIERQAVRSTLDCRKATQLESSGAAPEKRISIPTRRNSMTTVTPDSIMQVASGFMASTHLFVAIAVGLFNGLAAGQPTLDDLSHRTGASRSTIAILHDA